MISCSDCDRSIANDPAQALPCGRQLPTGVADELLQLGLCRQKMIDAVQGGRAEHAAVVGRTVFRIARALHAAAIDR